MSQSTPATLLLDSDRAILTIWLNRPQARNAMSLEMVAELEATLAEAEANGTRVLILRGSGGHFCSGGDVKDMAAARMRSSSGGDAIAEVNARFGHLCAAFAKTPVVTIAVVEGAVMGGGFGLACTADIVIASQTVAFGLPETSLGLVPAQIAPFLVERIGYAKAKRLAVSGARIEAAEAMRAGLVDHMCENAADLEATIEATIRQCLGCAPKAIAETKQLLRLARFEKAEDLIAHAAGVFAKVARAPEGAEGTAAFVEKRKPAWAV